MKNIIFAVPLICLSLSVPAFSSARGDLAAGNRAYNREKYDAAMEKYVLAANAAPKAAEPVFNIGNVHYKTGSYDEAVKSYGKATYSKDIKRQAAAYYNTGNALFRLEKLPEAVQFYKKAIELDPGDKDAKFNLEYAQKKIKENAGKNKDQKDQQNQQDKKDGKDKKESGDKGDKGKKQENKDKKQEKKEENKQENSENKKDGMSKEDAQRLLDALGDEKKTNKKADMKVPLFIMPEKDW